MTTPCMDDHTQHGPAPSIYPVCTVQALLREAIEVLRTGEIVLEEGEVAVATGQQLLLDARNLYQVRGGRLG